MCSRRADAVLILVALPGVDPDKVELAIRDGMLLMAGERVLPQELRTAIIHRLELPQGRFERQVPLPPGSLRNSPQRRRQRVPGDPPGQGAASKVET